MFLLLEINKLNKEQEILYNRFLLERYLINFRFNKLKKVTSIKDFKKDYRHILFVNKNYMTEKNYLSKYFKK